jgi:roadblock/LC7 domain-containing protein
MANIRSLLQMPGVVAVGEFDDHGELVDYAGEMSLKIAKVAAMMAKANEAMGNMQAAGYTEYTGKDGFFPITGFAVSGPKKSALIVKNCGVFVENDKADFDALNKALHEL